MVGNEVSSDPILLRRLAQQYEATMLFVGRPRARSLEVAAIFWHFVDLAWIPIFSFLYLLPST